MSVTFFSLSEIANLARAAIFAVPRATSLIQLIGLPLSDEAISKGVCQVLAIASKANADAFNASYPQTRAVQGFTVEEIAGSMPVAADIVKARQSGAMLEYNTVSNGGDDFLSVEAAAALEAMSEFLAAIEIPKSVAPLRRGVPILVYRSKHPDASNNGVSARHDELFLVGPDVPEATEPHGRPSVQLVREKLHLPSGNRTENLFIAPLDYQRGRHMFGGNFAFANDGRVRDALEPFGNCAIRIHDRTEG